MKKEVIDSGSDKVWVWTEEIDTENEKSAAPAEKSRIFSETGRKLLEKMMSERYLIDLSSEEKPLEREKNGKPYLRNHKGIYFNISHSGKFVSCAVGNIPLGLDIQFHKGGNFLKTAKKILSGEEWTEFEEAGCTQKNFFYFWTKKESYLKYTGEGIRRDLAALTYEGATFFTLKMEYGYTGMLCVPEGCIFS